jgi:hypothetical protein
MHQINYSDINIIIFKNIKQLLVLNAKVLGFLIFDINQMFHSKNHKIFISFNLLRLFMRLISSKIIKLIFFFKKYINVKSVSWWLNFETRFDFFHQENIIIMNTWW